MGSITIDREGFLANAVLPHKGPCRVATTVNVTLSGVQVIDGVTVESEDRVLVKDQTNTSQNAIYIVKSAEWELALDFDQRDHVVQGTRVFINQGTVNALTEWYVTTTGRPIPGRQAISFSQLSDGNALAEHLADSNGAHAASAIAFSPAGSIGATNAQAAIEELDSETTAALAIKQPLDADLTAIAALTPTDGNIIVGAGANWVAESGATARTSLGLGTGDSPEFASVNVGATDTTVTRTGAGDIAVEGNGIYRAGGTDVPVADGGSGRSSATAFAVLCGGTTTTNPHQSIAGVGASGEVLTSNGAGALPTFQAAAGGIVARTAQATSTGTAFDFDVIPAGVKRVSVLFDEVSLSGTGQILVQIGDAAGIASTGYVSGASINVSSVVSQAASAIGFNINPNNADRFVSGIMTIANLTGNVWVASHACGDDVPMALVGGGRKTLSDTLDRVRITRSTTDIFDNGQVNIFYE